MKSLSPSTGMFPFNSLETNIINNSDNNSIIIVIIIIAGSIPGSSRILNLD
jgi:hypothetical protein